MPGDSLTIIFKATKLGTQENVATVEYPKRDGTTGKSSDPAKVRSSGGNGGNTPGWWGGGYSGWGSGWRPNCWDGRQNGAEFCDRGGRTENILDDWKLFKNENIYDKRYAGWKCTSDCKLQAPDNKELPKCFNVQNGSISIMKWEVLPFYWNIEGLMGNRTRAEKEKYLNNTFFTSKNDNSCSSVDEGKIDLRTLQCTFAVYSPGSMNLNTPLYRFEAPCVNQNGWSDANGKIYSRIKSFITQNRNGWLGGSHLSDHGSVKNVFDSLDNPSYPVLMPISSKMLIKGFWTSSAAVVGATKDRTLQNIDISTFGEYKIALEDMTYQTCEAGKDKNGKETYQLSSKNPWYQRICEVDFTVTDHYMIQRSPYGIGNKATTNLDKYGLMNGSNFMKTYFPNTPIHNDAYQTPSSMKSLFITFKNKYQKLAKPVKGKEGLSKVPGKSIYLVSGKEINLKNLIADSSKPFTLIATDSSANITIKEDLNTNAMIMTQGTITFDASNSCNGGDRKSGHAGQIVKGIFYAGDRFRSSGDANLKNTYEKLSDGDRCNYGNLHIKGVAIGDLSKVVSARRSELYTWFQGNGGGKDGEEKVKKIINGASVLVDYNPTLRGNLPPGANEFNKALAVYRK